MTMPASIDPEQRGHFCPATTAAFLPLVRTVTSTVWVQMGQYTFPLAVRISIGFLVTMFLGASFLDISCMGNLLNN
jgi:hypothetical protein